MIYHTFLQTLFLAIVMYFFVLPGTKCSCPYITYAISCQLLNEDEWNLRWSVIVSPHLNVWQHLYLQHLLELILYMLHLDVFLFSFETNYCCILNLFI